MQPIVQLKESCIDIAEMLKVDVDAATGVLFSILAQICNFHQNERVINDLKKGATKDSVKIG